MNVSPGISTTENSNGPTTTTTSAHSPFLHNISQRLRKSSGASHASSRSSETNSAASHHDLARTTDQFPQDANAQATKRYLHGVMRDDWEYPGCVSQDSQGQRQLQRKPVAYRLRDVSVSDYEDEKGRRGPGSQGDPYKFDSPDAVGHYVAKRKRRRQRLLEEEMKWNQGLRLWTERRDMWTGAVTQPATSSQSPASVPIRPTEHRASSLFMRHTRTISQTSTRSTSSSSDNGLIDPRLESSETSLTSAQHDSDRTRNNPQQPHGPYLPIYPPLLPASHNLRARITPKAYATIYSKVVIQSLAPNVPIPLDHMISALVTGWKAEGNWPPTPLESITPNASSLTAIGTHRDSRGRVKKGETAFARWKKEQEERKMLEETIKPRGKIKGVLRRVVGRKPDDGDPEVELEKIGLTFEEAGSVHDPKIRIENEVGNENDVEDEEVKDASLLGREVDKRDLLIDGFVYDESRLGPRGG